MLRKNGVILLALAAAIILATAGNVHASWGRGRGCGSSGGGWGSNGGSWGSNGGSWGSNGGSWGGGRWSSDSYGSCECGSTYHSDQHDAKETKHDGERHESGYRGERTSDSNQPKPATTYRESRSDERNASQDRDQKRENTLIKQNKIPNNNERSSSSGVPTTKNKNVTKIPAVYI